MRRLVAATGLLVACGRVNFDELTDADVTPAPYARLYVPTWPDGVTVFTIDRATGQPTAAGSYPTTPGGRPDQIVFARTRRFAYVVSEQSSDVAGYAVDPETGALQPLPGPPTTGNGISSPRSAAVDPTGAFLYVANGTGGISGFQIDPSIGELSAIAVTAATAPQTLQFDPSGQFLYAGLTDNAGGVAGFSYSAATGALVPLAGSPWSLSAPGPAPWQLVFHPSGRWLFATDQGNGRTLWASVDSTSGVLAPQPVQVTFGGLVFGQAFNGDGTHLYQAVCGGPNGMLRIDVDPATGMHVRPGSVQFPSACPVGVAVDRAATHLYVADFSDGLATYTFAPNGDLVRDNAPLPISGTSGYITLVESP